MPSPKTRRTGLILVAVSILTLLATSACGTDTPANPDGPLPDASILVDARPDAAPDARPDAVPDAP